MWALTREDRTPVDGWLSQRELLALHETTLRELTAQYPGLHLHELEALTVAALASNPRIGA